MNKTFVVMAIALMAALSIATIATVIETAAALPPAGTPGSVTATCASTAQSQGAADCQKPPRPSRP
jgi:hypothetical protein